MLLLLRKLLQYVLSKAHSVYAKNTINVSMLKNECITSDTELIRELMCKKCSKTATQVHQNGFKEIALAEVAVRRCSVRKELSKIL